jgi:general secretion pathway protein L
MTALSIIREGFSHWLDIVTDAAVAGHGRLVGRRVIKLAEAEDGVFVLASDQSPSKPGEVVRVSEGRALVPDSLSPLLPGSHVELILKPAHFLFQPLELPDRAIEFLDGIIRAQIDRLTPWRAGDAAFGFSQPDAPVDGRITVTVAAAPRDVITPYLDAMTALGAPAVSISTRLPDADPEAAPIKLIKNEVRGGPEVARVRRRVRATLLAASIAAGLGIMALVTIDAMLAARQDELAHEIGRARAAAVASRDPAAGSLAAVRSTLAQRKRTEPSSVFILETLSKALPDDTYLTELRIEQAKLHLTGVTKDAPSLIGLIEQSGFIQASFFAPTTRSPSEPGERFHIEAIIRPRS